MHDAYALFRFICQSWSLVTTLHHLDYAAEPSYLHRKGSALVQHVLSRNGTHIGVPLPPSCRRRPFVGFKFARGLHEAKINFHLSKQLRRSYFCFLIEKSTLPQPTCKWLLSIRLHFDIRGTECGNYRSVSPLDPWCLKT